MRYIVTQEIKSQPQVAKGIYVTDFFFLLAYAGIIMILSNLVNGTLKIPYMIFASLAGLWMVGSSLKNRKRKNIQSVFLFLRKDRVIYRPISVDKRKVRQGIHA
ncbi:MAG: DUF5592 family protein [Lachnospiraceae bacterium]|nr:DUF5592 family protein [Lachnospiraceae bacterium]